MSAERRTSESPLEELDPQQCWALLATGKVGRIAFTDRALPAIRPLNYAVDGRRIVLRVAGDALGRRLHEQVVAFEVDELDVEGQSGWSVLVIGTVELLDAGGAALRAVPLPRSWVGPGHHAPARLTVGEISGRRLVGR